MTTTGPLPFPVSYWTSYVGPHPMHRALVAGVGAEIGRFELLMRWIDVDTPKLWQYTSWMVNGYAMPNLRRHDLLVLEGFQVPAALSRWMGRLDPRQKIVCHHTAEQLYFLLTGFYKPSTAWMMRKVMSAYDAHICVGKEQTRLLHAVMPGLKAPVYNVYCTHVSQDKYERFSRITPAIDAKKLLFVGHIYGDWRVHYKGLDLLLDAFDIAARRDPGLSLSLVGVATELGNRLVSQRCSPEAAARIEVIPFASDLAPLLASHSLFVLPAKGDAFPCAVLEAMSAGMPPLLSEDTGNKEVAHEVDPSLVSPLAPSALAQRMLDYTSAPPERRAELSARSRSVVSRFTEAHGVANFREALSQIHRDLGAGHPALTRRCLSSWGAFGRFIGGLRPGDALGGSLRLGGTPSAGDYERGATPPLALRGGQGAAGACRRPPSGPPTPPSPPPVVH